MTRKHDTIRMRANVAGGVTKVELLINYKIATGLVRDPKTHALQVEKPQKFVKTVTISLADRPAVVSSLSIGSSDDPFLAFKLKGGKAGDRIRIHWADNLGNWDELTGVVSA